MGNHVRHALQCIAAGDLDLLQLLWIIEKPSEKGETRLGHGESRRFFSPLIPLLISEYLISIMSDPSLSSQDGSVCNNLKVLVEGSLWNALF